MNIDWCEERKGQLMTTGRYEWNKMLASLLAVLAVALGLTACGGGSGDDAAPSYSLRINNAVVNVNQPTALLTGEGFLPPGSTCSGGCSLPLPPPVFGQLGPYTLTWANAATGEKGEMRLSWICNCGGSYWMTSVPLAPGENRISVMMRAGPYEQNAEVVVTTQ